MSALGCQGGWKVSAGVRMQTANKCLSQRSSSQRTVQRNRRASAPCTRALLTQAPGVEVTWEESVDEVSIRVPVGNNVQRNSLKWEVHPSRLALTLGDTQLLAGPFPDGQIVDIDGCYWTLEREDGGSFVEITLEKQTMGEKSWQLLLESDARAVADVKATEYAFFELTKDGEPLGKVVLGLFGGVVPRTVANFKALCTGEKGTGEFGVPLHYKGSKLHRIITGFMAQGGDFTRGDGTGGESIYGKTFEDENFQLTHDTAGLLSCANAGTNTNGSQFFITYAATPHLDGKHVVFGRVESGMDIMRQVEELGSASGEPSAEILIADCGALAPSEVKAFIADAAAQQMEAQIAEFNDK